MTPQERDLIQSVFDRLAQAGQMGRDPEAEALIRDHLARQPEAPYGLVQAVIMLEMSLTQTRQQMAELQRQLAANRAPAPAGGSFLGGGAGPWGSVPNSGPQQAYAAPVPPQAPSMFAPQAPAVGGFLRNAATMAAGVAGGTLLAEGLSSLFGGHHGGMGGSPWGGGQPEVVENVTNNYYDGQGGDGGFDTASYDDGGGYDDGASSYDDGSDLV